MNRILFMCVENSCRSQMAEGFANHLGRDILETYSAGSRPSGKIDLNAIEVMREIGIDISQQKSKEFNELPIKEFDYAITLGCKDICPFIPANKHIEWNIEDPKDKDIESFRKVRDQIKNNIMDLIKELSKRKDEREVEDGKTF